jgi:hypothetical protein
MPPKRASNRTAIRRNADNMEATQNLSNQPSNHLTTPSINDETLRLLTSALVPILTENIISSLSEKMTTQHNGRDQPTSNTPQVEQQQPTSNSLHVEVNPAISLQTFDGTNDIIDFINSFKSAALVNNWSGERQVAIIQAYLRGQAFEFVSKLPIEERNQIDLIFLSLKKKFLNNSLCLNQKPKQLYVHLLPN